MTKELSNEAPIILTWVPRVRGASLPDGKNSALNYLDILKNHKLKNKEERDMYLVINGPGFEQNQIDDLKRELKEIQGVHVVDLHQYDWSEIDQRRKIDGKDISIKDFFKNMYDMTDEQRTYFAIEIDTFRLIALALSEKMTGQKGAIYIDFDALNNIKDHIGKDITIPKGILLGSFRILTMVTQNNDLIAISNPSVAINILYEYKDKLLSQKEIYNKAVKYVQDEKAESVVVSTPVFSTLKELGYTDRIERLQRQFINHKKICNEKLEILSNGGIEALYNSNIVDEAGLNPALLHTINMARSNPVNGEKNQWELVAFGKNNGNYAETVSGDLSWTRGEDLYHKQIDNKLERAKVEHSLGDPLKVVSEANVSSVEDLKLKMNNPR